MIIEIKYKLQFTNSCLSFSQIEARESGTVVNQQSSTATVTLTLFDTNDNSPIFTSGVYQANIREDRSVGYSVLTVTVCIKAVNTFIYQLSNINYSTRPII